MAESGSRQSASPRPECRALFGVVATRSNRPYTSSFGVGAILLETWEVQAMPPSRKQDVLNKAAHKCFW